jgi:alpha-beta hydrolase superfamily lysophospholipase
MAVTELARQMIASYYGQPWKKSYFMGCSNGGRQALLAAQRFPLAFDGVMSVAPAARVGTATISSVWETIAFSEIAPEGRRGTSDSFQGVLQWRPDAGGPTRWLRVRFEGRREGRPDLQYKGMPLRSGGTHLQGAQD